MLENLLRTKPEFVALPEDKSVALGERLQGLATDGNRLPLYGDLIRPFRPSVTKGAHLAELDLRASTAALVDHHPPSGALQKVHHLRLRKAAGYGVNSPHHLLQGDGEELLGFLLAATGAAKFAKDAFSRCLENRLVESPGGRAQTSLPHRAIAAGGGAGSGARRQLRRPPAPSVGARSSQRTAALIAVAFDGTPLVHHVLAPDPAHSLTF